MTKENKDYGKSVKAKLLNLSKAEGLPYQPLLIRYVQERLLYRLAQSRYKHRFYLKGGALLYAHEQFKARPTLDIDFLGNSIANDKKNSGSFLKLDHASPLELFFRNFKNQYDNPPHGTNSFNNMEPIVSTAWNQ